MSLVLVDDAGLYSTKAAENVAQFVLGASELGLASPGLARLGSQLEIRLYSRYPSYEEGSAQDLD